MLDIGCRWGPMLKAAEERRGHGVGLTLSTKQAEACRHNGLEAHVTSGCPSPLLARPTSQNSPSETVWKIAEGFSIALLWRQEGTDQGSLDPMWPLSDSRFWTLSEFPN